MSGRADSDAGSAVALYRYRRCPFSHVVLLKPFPQYQRVIWSPFIRLSTHVVSGYCLQFPTKCLLFRILIC
jgi:hypothetical protein